MARITRARRDSLFQANYARDLMQMFGSAVVSYLPLDDTGTTAADFSGSGRAGSHSITTRLQSGMGDGRYATWFNGSNSYVRWYSAALAAAMNGKEGTLLLWMKPNDVGVWTDATSRYLAVLQASAGNTVYFQKSTTANRIYFVYKANSVNSTPTGLDWFNTDWAMLALTWSYSGDAVKSYWNGAQVSGTKTGLGEWAGSVADGWTQVGANGGPANVWSGWLAHALLLNRPATPVELLSAFTLARPITRISVFGDSISAATGGWQQQLRDVWRRGALYITNHAVSGAKILHDGVVTDLADETASCADNADIAFILMGTNDTTDVGLQTALENGIDAIRAANPRVTVYLITVLKRWTDNTTGSEVDKSAIRAAEAAACASRHVKVFDSYTAPWLLQADMDAAGLHPGSIAAHKKIVDALMPLLGN